MQRRLKPYRLFLHLLILAPIPILGILAMTGRLGFNPIQTLQQRSGQIALVLLLLSLACKPLYLLTHNPFLLSIRRMLGLYAFLYSLLHVLNFLVLDYGLDLKSAFIAVTENPYLWSGVTAFLLLLIMAITSIDRVRIVLRKSWKKIQSLVYVASFLVILHFGLSIKGNIFHLRGNITFPLLAFIFWLILIGFRILAAFRKKVQS